MKFVRKKLERFYSKRNNYMYFESINKITVHAPPLNTLITQTNDGRQQNSKGTHTKTLEPKKYSNFKLNE